MNPLRRSQSSLRWTIVVALAALLGGLLGLMQQQFRSDYVNAKSAAQDELELLTAITRGMLESGQFQAIPRLLDNWGQHTPGILELHIHSTEQGILGTFRREHASSQPLRLENTFDLTPGNRATVAVTKDLRGIFAQRNVLAIQLAIAFSTVAAILIYLARLWHLRQRETAALNRANAALHLENQQRREAEAALHEAKERAEVTVNAITDGVVTTGSDGIIRYLNPVAERLLGWNSAEAVGHDIAEVLFTLDERTRTPEQNPVSRCLATGVAVKPSNYTLLVARNGRELPIEDSCAPLHDQQGNIIGTVLILHDVSASRELANRLSWQATHDSLTGLINRREFDHRVTQASLDAHGEHSEHALLYIDLDQFKTVNDVCGHVAGDVLLQQVSTLMQNRMRANDTLARLGGDEFGVLLMNCPPAQAQRIADGLLRCMREFRFVWERRTFEIGASIGLVMITRNSGDLAAILYAADFACYTAKEQGRNRLYIYPEHAKLPGKGPRNRIQASTLRDALALNKFVLFGQSIEPLSPGQPRHCEVLLRLRGARNKLLMPGHFIPSADRHELMPTIDRWVIANVLTSYAKFLRSAEAENLRLHINLSSASLLEGDIADFVQDLTRKQRVPADRLCFDISEAIAVSHLTQALKTMRDLREIGSLLTLDDFGSGLSSFGHLKSLSLDFVNISGQLIAHLDTEAVNRAVIGSVVSICHSLNVITIAKHVSSDRQREWVTALGVDYAQGFAIAPPALLGSHLRLELEAPHAAAT